MRNAHLLGALFDDAALFPPGNAAMPEAVRGHADYRNQWYAGLVGLFVCPSTRLAELDAELRGAGGDPLPVSVTVPGGVAAVEEAMQLAASATMVNLRAIELPVGTAGLAESIGRLHRATPTGVHVFAEVPVTELSREAADTLAAAGIGLKLRTGGTTAAAFPDAGSLGAAITAAVGSGAPFKFTAGLHNAVAHQDPATGFCHHGFLNVLLAAHAAQTGTDPTEPLTSRDAELLARSASGLSPGAVADLRTQFRSIGSCSITEPLTDLENLGLVTAP